MRHDPLCPKSDYENARQLLCECDLVAEVRADERERTNTVGGHRQIRDEGRADMCADLRAKVEALPTPSYSLDINGMQVLVGGIEGVIRRSDVLALLDGSNE